MRKIGLKFTGGSHGYIKNKINEYGLDISHFTGSAHNTGSKSNKRKHWKEILIKRKSGREKAFILRRALIESGREYRCADCGLLPVWNYKEIRFQIDHLNRVVSDDRPENLRFICPNCHSQTTGFSGSQGLTDVDNTNRYQRVRRQTRKLNDFAGVV